jgi:hypothetical protein
MVAFVFMSAWQSRVSTPEAPDVRAGWISFVCQLIAGLAILGAVWALLLKLSFPVLLLAFVGPQLAFVLNAVWIGLMLGMLVFGARRGRRGFVLAPFVFCAGWLVASIVDREDLEKSIDPRVWAAPLSAEAKAERTLIVNAHESIDAQVVRDGYIDRMVVIHHDSGANDKIWRIAQASIARGEACAAAGGEACLQWRDLGEIPDGLRVESEYQVHINQGARGCAKTHARLRRGSDERELLTWFRCQAYVLSYVPVLGFFNEPASIWGFGGGPVHPVRYGQPDIATRTVISAIYGAPRYERTATVPPPATVPPEELIDRVASLARLPNMSSKSAALMLEEAQRRGVVNARAIETAAAFAGRDIGWETFETFIDNLTGEQTTLVLDKVFERLETPRICDYCAGNRRGIPFHAEPWLKLATRLPDPAAAVARARRLFADRSDLATWQYEEALRIMLALSPRQEVQSTLFVAFQLLAADRSAAFFDKASAYKLATRSNPSDEQKAVLLTKLDLIRDEQLKDFIADFWSVNLSYMQENWPRHVLRQAAAACDRISRVSDPRLQNELRMVKGMGMDGRGRVDCSVSWPR